MVRRRFFPATTVQAVPGRTVELEMQLRPVAKVASSRASSPGEGETPMAGWFSPSFSYYGEWPEWVQLPDGRWEVFGAYDSSIWEGIANGVDGQPPVPAADFRCVELSAPGRSDSYITEHVGVLQGASMTDVRWEATWDAPSAEDPSASIYVGNRYVTWGNVILVRQVYTYGWGINGESGVQTLTATAYSGASPIATLVFNSIHDAY